MVNARLLTVGFLAVVAIILCAGCAPTPSSVERQNYQLSEENKKLQEDLRRTENQLGQIDGMYKAQLKTNEDQVASLTRENSKLSAERDAVLKAFNELKKAGPVQLPAALTSELEDVNAKVGEAFEIKGNLLRFKSDVLFDSGSAKVKDSFVPVLKDLAGVFKSDAAKDVYLRIDGHTDNVPTSVSGFKDNLQLSAERARSVFKVLEANGVGSNRMFVAGFGEFYPRVPNDTKENRAKNRRVEIYLLLTPPTYLTAD